MNGDESSALVQSTAKPTWPTLIPEIVKRRHFHIVDQTPESAQALHESMSYFCDGKVMPHEVESTLFEAFIEDDYDGALHLTTINDERDTPIGLVFWREVPEEEMKEWINYEKLAQFAKTQYGQTIGDDGKYSICDKNTRSGTELQTKEKRMNAVRRASFNWLVRTAETQNHEVPPDYAHAWVKIELLAVRPPWWGQGVGSLLLACALYEAWLCNSSRVILHVAGGTANVPAVRLYERFGFVPASDIFNKPDKDIFVLGNIGLALQSLAWSETLEQDRNKAMYSIADTQDS